MRRTLLLPLLLLGGCEQKSTSAPASVGSSSSKPQGAPALPPEKGVCPIRVIPGRALGSIEIGQDTSTLAASKSTLRQGTTEFFDAGPFRVRACGGKVAEAWLEDLRQAPDCVTYGGKPVDRAMPREKVIALFAKCHELPARKGGDFTECEDGGMRIGSGMGDFIQVRVNRVGSDIDDECEDVLDEGKPAALPDIDRGKLLQRTLDLDVLTPFWHPTQPGRAPLRTVKNDVVRDQALSMFGSAVVFVDPAVAAKDKKPYFELTKLEATARRVTITFRYPIEGVAGSVVFQKRGDEWNLKEKHVTER